MRIELRNVAVVSLMLLISFSVGCRSGSTADTRPWRYGPGEVVSLGGSWEVKIPEESNGRIDVPLGHKPGDPDLAYLPMKVFRGGDETYVIGIESRVQAQERVSSIRRLIREGEYPRTSLLEVTIDGMQCVLSVTDDLDRVIVEAYVSRGLGDVLWIQAEGGQSLTDIARGGSPSELAKLIIGRLGVNPRP